MTRNEHDLRVVIAVTESASLAQLWRTAMEMLRDSHAEVVALFLDDERWHRAASLPFTREISKVGSVADFTTQRANQVHAETVSDLRQRIEQLAAEADVTIEFRVLAESDHALPDTIVGGGGSILIAPSRLANRPIYAELTRLDLRIELVETEREEPDTEEGDKAAQQP